MDGWEKFAVTGKVEDYLTYAGQKTRETGVAKEMEGRSGAGEDQRNRDSAKTKSDQRI